MAYRLRLDLRSESSSGLGQPGLGGLRECGCNHRITRSASGSHPDCALRRWQGSLSGWCYNPCKDLSNLTESTEVWVRSWRVTRSVRGSQSLGVFDIAVLVSIPKVGCLAPVTSGVTAARSPASLHLSSPFPLHQLSVTPTWRCTPPRDYWVDLAHSTLSLRFSLTTICSIYGLFPLISQSSTGTHS